MKPTVLSDLFLLRWHVSRSFPKFSVTINVIDQSGERAVVADADGTVRAGECGNSHSGSTHREPRGSPTARRNAQSHEDIATR
jgi:hypothetical protein